MDGITRAERLQPSGDPEYLAEGTSHCGSHGEKCQGFRRARGIAENNGKELVREVARESGVGQRGGNPTGYRQGGSGKLNSP